MARVTVDDCIKHIPNRFEMTLVAAYRARQISTGSGLTGVEILRKGPH